MTLDISKNELRLSSRYSVFRKDRIAKKGGGVFIAVKNALHVVSHVYSHGMEAISVRIQPPTVTNFYDSLSDFLNALSLTAKDTLFLAGDFNYADIHWPALPSQMSPEYIQSLSPSSRKFIPVTESFALSQAVEKPTWNNTLLDLFFTSKPESIISVTYLEPLSDHVQYRHQS